MAHSYKALVSNVVLRGVTLASRFCFVFFVARLLGPKELGTYGLFTAAIGYSLYFVGLDFYTYSTRDILKRSANEWGGLLKSQGALVFVLYSLLFPLLAVLFLNDILPVQYVLYFFPLLVLEHVNQELGRIFNAASKQLLTSMLLFIRQGTWAIVVVLLMIADAKYRTLHYIFWSWMLSGIAAIVLGGIKLKRMRLGGWAKTVDWQWIGRGLRVCLPLLLSTMALQAIFTLDRYWINYLNGVEVVGAYVLYFGLASTMITFLDAAVFSFALPRLIKAYHEGQLESFHADLALVLGRTIFFCIVFSIGTLVIIEPLVDWIGNPLFKAFGHIYYLLLVVMCLYALSMIPHYGLYAMGLDRIIVFSHTSGAMVFIGTTWALSSQWPQIAVLLGLIAAFGYISVIKAIAFISKATLRV